MLTLACLVARALHEVVTGLVARGPATPDYESHFYRLTYRNERGRSAQLPRLGPNMGIDWHTTSRLVVWRQDFPGADLTVLSDLTAPLLAHYR